MISYWSNILTNNIFNRWLLYFQALLLVTIGVDRAYLSFRPLQYSKYGSRRMFILFIVAGGYYLGILHCIVVLSYYLYMFFFISKQYTLIYSYAILEDPRYYPRVLQLWRSLSSSVVLSNGLYRTSFKISTKILNIQPYF